jgi:acyl-CoA thioesterase FadM
VRDADGAVLAEGETAHVVTDAQMKMRALPEKYARAMQDATTSTSTDGRSHA